MELTVIVTVYNIAEYLPRFFESMFAQTYKDFILLMIDDGSNDESLEVCKYHAEKDNRIKVVSLEHVGIAKARNIAMSYIETPFTSYADGDDYVEPDYLLHLMSAIKKYNADLAISRVEYQLEAGAVEGTFRERGELYFEKADFNKNIPMLLDDRRLNYLYGKVYRSELLKNIRIEDDVRQGSDTMINFQYINAANSIVLIDDLDYHYIRYSNRSVTSYSGEDAFLRICRINRFVFDYSKSHGMLTDNLTYIIDSRVLQSAVWVIDKIIASNNSIQKKSEQIDNILNDGFYIQSYNRQSENIKDFSFDVIPPQSGKRYLKSVMRKNNSLKRRAKILSHCPDFIVQAYHKLKGNG